jgi:Ran GTPase-activating protein (RanGAP) involved in mRNA processing and transport
MLFIKLAIMLDQKRRTLPLIKRKLSPRNATSRRLPHITSPREPESATARPLRLNSLASDVVSDSDHFKKQPYPGPIGEPAKLDFYNVYRDLVKTKQKNRFKLIEDSPNTAYLLEAERRGLKPLSVGISRTTGSESTIDIRYRLIGDNYAKALSKGMKHMHSLQHLNLKSNRLSELGSTSILKRIQPNKLQDLNLSDNRLGESSIAVIVEILQDGRSRVRSLDLENTGVRGKMLTGLMAAVSDSHSLRSLSLARNALGELDAVEIALMLRHNDSLQRLDLHWNGLKGEGAVKLFSEGLVGNDFLMELDLSFNALGSSHSQVAEALGLALRHHTRLGHLDLSYNYFDEAETRTLSGLLADNHTLFGLHYEGNDGLVDARGFIKVQTYASNSGNAHTFRRIFSEKGRSATEKNCWICHGWKEVKFSWKPGQSGMADVEPIYLHLECDDYLPESLPLLGDEFSVTRIVPDSRCNFFYSFKGSPMLSEVLPSRLYRASARCEFWAGYVLQVEVQTVNYVKPTGPAYSLEAPLAIRPRVDPYVYLPPAAEKERIPWSIPISLFKDYRFDTPVKPTQDHYQKCFEFDWSCCKVPRLIKDPGELANIKETLRARYRHM